jgi:hypothetical protein
MTKANKTTEIMKATISFICMTFSLLVFSGTSSAQNFKKLAEATDSTYAYTANNPLKLKNGDPGESIVNTRNFIKVLKTKDDQDLVLLGRNSMPDPNFKPSPDFLKDFGRGGILDRYTFVTSATRDTIRLYVDIYHKEKLMIPLGLKYVKPD